MSEKHLSMESQLTFDPFFKQWYSNLKVSLFGLLLLLQVLLCPTGSCHIIFAFSAVRHHTWFPVILRKSIYPIFTKFGMGIYWVNSLHVIGFGEDSSIATAGFPHP